MQLPHILVDDDTLVAFNKPSGVSVVAEKAGKSSQSLMRWVHERFGPAVANVHRLDAETSGVLLCAKTKPSLDFLSGQFQSKTVRRTYHGLVVLLPADDPGIVAPELRSESGVLPAAFTVDLALGEDEHQVGRMRVFRRRGGKPAVTQVRILESFGRFAWVECRPLTGRTHQVRAHLAAAGAPLLNDDVYGDPVTVLLLSDIKRHYKGRDEERPLITRLALHASGLGIVHPESQLPMEITAPMPTEFEIALKYLRKFAGPVRPGR